MIPGSGRSIVLQVFPYVLAKENSDHLVVSEKFSEEVLRQLGIFLVDTGNGVAFIWIYLVR